MGLRYPMMSLLLTALLAACGGRPTATLLEQTAALTAPEDAQGWAQFGWWQYLSGDVAAARKAFSRSGDTALGRLGVARIARDRLDQALVNATLLGLDDAGVVGRIAEAWRDRSASSLAATGLSGPISTLPSLTLHRLRLEPPKISQSTVIVFGREFPLLPTAPSLRNRVHLGVWEPPTGAWVRISTLGPVVVWVDGQEIAQSPLDAGPLSTTVGPISGQMTVAWVGVEKARVTVLSTASKLPKGILPSVPNRAEGIDWFRRYLVAEAARATGHYDRAYRALLDAPKTAAFEALRAELVESEAGLPGNMVRDRALMHWRAALPIAPIRAQLHLANHLRSAGRHRESLDHLERLLDEAPNRASIRVSHIRTLLALERYDDARRAFTKLDALSGSSCAHVPLRQRVFGRSSFFASTVAEMLARCGRPLDGAQHVLDMNRPEAALRLLDAMTEHPVGYTVLRVRVLLALGRLKDAQVLVSRLKLGGGRQLALDLSGAPRSSEKEAQIREWALSNIDDPDALSVMEARPEWSALTHLLSRTEDAIADFERSGESTGRATRVLDHSVLYFDADGHSIRRVHEVLAVSSRQAAEEFGELALPEGARAVLVYTRKADGRLRFAESTPEKESLSLPDLEPGDYLVATYLEPGDRGYSYSHGFLSQRAYFADLGVNIFSQTFDVIPPTEIRPHVEVSSEITQVSVEPVGDRKVLRFRRDGAPAVPVEPRSLDPALFMPSLRVGGGISLQESVDRLRDQVLHQRQLTLDFRLFIKEAVGERTGREAARIALGAIRRRYDSGAGLVDHPVRQGLYDGQGHRALAFSSALEVLGIDHALYLARPNHQRPPSRFVTTDDFEVTLVRLADGTWVYPIHDGGALGYLPFPLLGGEAIQLWPVVPLVNPVPLPTTRTVRDGRRATLRAHWTADGKITGEIEDVLTGQEAVSIAGYLRQLEPSQRPRLVERLLVHVISTARVTHLEPPALDGGETLALRYRFEARVGDQINLGLFPMRPGRTFASLVDRSTPLYIDLPAHQRIDVSIKSERPLDSSAKSVEETHDDYHISRQVSLDGKQLRVTASLDIQGGLIKPTEYDAFRTWARAADGIERMVLRIRGPAKAQVRPVKEAAHANVDGERLREVGETP